MGIPVILKVYAALFPADEQCRAAVACAASDAMGTDEEWLFLEGDLLRISWEGIAFPVEEVLSALAPLLHEHVEGKVDVLDLEAWTLSRYVFRDGAFHGSTRSLNHVLDYSGH